MVFLPSSSWATRDASRTSTIEVAIRGRFLYPPGWFKEAYRVRDLAGSGKNHIFRGMTSCHVSPRDGAPCWLRPGAGTRKPPVCRRQWLMGCASIMAATRPAHRGDQSTHSNMAGTRPRHSSSAKCARVSAWPPGCARPCPALDASPEESKARPTASPVGARHRRPVDARGRRDQPDRSHRGRRERGEPQGEARTQDARARRHKSPGIATSKHAGPATSKQDHLTAPRRPRPRCPQAELTVRADSQQAYADLPTPFPGDDHLARAASTARAFFVADRLAAFKRIGIENHRYRDLSSVFITAHSITSSAKASRLGGMVRPTALAVLRLIARWNLGIAPASR
jgi:hypothetical protein